MSGNMRDRILNHEPKDTSQIVPLPEWDGAKAEVRGMPASERIDYLERRQQGDEPLTHSLWNLVLNCTYDPETGERMFDPADRDVVLSKEAGPFERLWRTANRVSGLNEEAAAEQAAAFQEEPGT